MIAAAVPLAVGLGGVLFARFRLGVVFGLIVSAGLVSALMAYAQPLPSGKVTLAPVEGLQLPHSVSMRRHQAQPLIALTPGSVWLDGLKVDSVAVAVSDPRVITENPDVLVLAVDGRVSFGDLVNTMDAAGKLGRHDFDLVVQNGNSDLVVVRIRDATRIPANHQLRLTLRVTDKEVEVLAIGGALAFRS